MYSLVYIRNKYEGFIVTPICLDFCYISFTDTATVVSVSAVNKDDLGLLILQPLPSECCNFTDILRQRVLLYSWDSNPGLSAC